MYTNDWYPIELLVIHSNTLNDLTVCKIMISGSLKKKKKKIQNVFTHIY